MAWLLALAFGGLAVVALGAGGWFLLRSQPTPAAASQPPPTVKLQTEEPDDIAVSPGARIATVKLDVEPADVLVEVDGVAQVVRHGTVDVTGAVGSKVSIVLHRGDQTQETAVAITDNGPIPSKVSFDANSSPTRATGAGSRPAVASKPAPAPAPEPAAAPAPEPQPKPTPKKSGLTLSNEFE